MNSLLRAIPEMKVEVAEKAPLLLAHVNGTAVPVRSDIIARERPAGRGPLEDIAAARMKDLAARIAGGAVLQVVPFDAPLDQADAEIAPLSLAAITGLRGIRARDDDTTSEVMLPPAPAAPAETITVASEPVPTAVVATPVDPHLAHSERDLKSLLAVLEPPVPLQLAQDEPTKLVARTDPRPETAEIDAAANEATEIEPLAADATETVTGELVPREERPSTPGEPLMLSDQSADQPVGDRRLVDLIKRQQSMLEQLNRYPTPPAAAPTAERPAARTPAPPASPIVDKLVAPPPSPALTAERPPLPSPGPLRLSAEPPEVATEALPERSPMIIQRARAERSGHYDPRGASTRPSALPAFAAGVAAALAIAGTLFFLL